jgi:hypothetical protein
MERAMGIEPTSEAWEASILPLYDARSVDAETDYTQLGLGTKRAGLERGRRWSGSARVAGLVIAVNSFENLLKNFWWCADDSK